MKWLTTPFILAAASAALAVGAALLILRSPPAQSKPTPEAVADGDREIAWLYPATNSAAWERFVASVRRAATRLHDDPIDVRAEIGAAAFPRETTAVPEVALALPGVGRRLVFRWYKLTSDWKTRDWVEALMRRRPPPLAIVGGSTSDAARELALRLQDHAGDVAAADRPLLLLTTATADRVGETDAAGRPQEVDLTKVYPQRTFRFCFTNKQMARAVMDFLMSQDDLRPDLNPVHMVQWDDDSYSRDLTDGFRQALPPWAGLPNPKRVTSSVGSFLSPNRFEAEVVDQVLNDLEQSHQRRPLLAVTGQSTPCRRFLAELARTAPAQARRLLVATGDAVSFNTVYRDRRVAWPIQELPFPFVFFCHYNPIDADAGFRPEGTAPRETDVEGERDVSTTGTEDILLDGDVVEALARAFTRDDKPPADSAELTERIAAIRRRHGRVGYDPDGVLMFGDDGNRHIGAGEHLVCLRPQFRGDRILPEATIEVWVGRGSLHADQPWRRLPVDKEGHETLTVSYEPPVMEEKAGP